ncbi:MAG: cytochrome c nitrite reductase small subunit [Bryobacteraceae bacterium]
MLRGVLSAVVGVLAGAGAYTFHFAEGLSYFSDDPNACANCHVMREYLEGWRKSSHHARAVCNDCHSPHRIVPKMITKADNGWNHSVKFTLASYGDPIRLRPVNAERLRANCVRCHAALVEDAAMGDDCLRCHAGVGHGPRR